MDVCGSALADIRHVLVRRLIALALALRVCGLRRGRAARAARQRQAGPTAAWGTRSKREQRLRRRELSRKDDRTPELNVKLTLIAARAINSRARPAFFLGANLFS